MSETVTKELCDAKMTTITTVLGTMQRDGEETRRGVGNLNRRLFEGNGSVALDTVITANAEWRLQQQKREEARRRFGWTRNLLWMIAGAGWVIAIILVWLQR